MFVQLVLYILVSSPAVFAQGNDSYLREDFSRGPGIFNTRCENSTLFEWHPFYEFPTIHFQNGSSGFYLTSALAEPASCAITGSKFSVDANATVVLSYFTSANGSAQPCLFSVLDGDGYLLVPKVIPIVNSGRWLTEPITVPRSTQIAMKFWCSNMTGSLLLVDRVEVLRPISLTTTTTTTQPPITQTPTTNPPTTLATTTTTGKGAASALQPHWILLLLQTPIIILRLIS